MLSSSGPGRGPLWGSRKTRKASPRLTFPEVREVREVREGWRQMILKYSELETEDLHILSCLKVFMVAATFKRTVVNPVKYVGPTKTKYLFRNFQFLKSSILSYPNMLPKVKRNIKRI